MTIGTDNQILRVTTTDDHEHVGFWTKDDGKSITLSCSSQDLWLVAICIDKKDIIKVEILYSYGDWKDLNKI